MTRFAYLSSLALFACLFVANQATGTNVGGIISANATWTAAGNPYIVTSSIIVTNNAMLTIQPGVEVQFNAGLGMTIGHASIGPGTLKAIGAAGQEIKFTSNILPGQPGQWLHFNFTDYSTDASFDGGGNYVSGCIMERCIVEFAGSGGTGTGAITISQSSPFLNYCEIRNCARSGIYANNSAAGVPTLQVKNCNVHHNASGAGQSGGGISIRLDGSNLVLSGNAISNNSSSVESGGLNLSLNGNNRTFSVAGNTIQNNVSSNGGGGALIYFGVGGGTGNVLTFSGNVLSGNQAGSGGACTILHYNDNSMTFSNNSMASNVATADGGALSLYRNGGGIASITGNTFVTNTSRNGGAVYLLSFSNSPTTFQGNQFTENVAAGQTSNPGTGGAIYLGHWSIPAGPVTFVQNTFTQNAAQNGPTGGTGQGGAIYVAGMHTLTFAGNEATNTFNVFTGNTATIGRTIYNNVPYNRNGINDIHAEYVCWGGDDPFTDLNLNYDFFDDATRSIILALNAVPSPCGIGGGCGSGYIQDCSGNCVPDTLLGNGLCNQNLNCEGLNFDEGDCAGSSTPITFADVVPSPLTNVGQFYAAYDIGSEDKFHTGIDLMAPFGTSVKAAYGGVVHKVFGLSTNGTSPMTCNTSSPQTNVRRWNSSNNSYTWQAQPTLDNSGQPYAHNNHGLGQCVIVWHPDLRLYTLYGHLDAVIDNLAPGSSVIAGQTIGQVGSSAFGLLRHCATGGVACGTPSGAPPAGCAFSSIVTTDSSGFNPHVHFEVKHFGTVANVMDDSCPPGVSSCWGYVPGVAGQGGPNLYGYVNPFPYFESTINHFSPKAVTVSGAGAQTVRTGPATGYTLQATTVDPGQKFVAFAEKNGWYQIYFPSSSGPATGWVQGTIAPATRILTVDTQIAAQNGSVNVRSGPAVVNSPSNQISKSV